jgi:2-polyprenyl-6-methoxyphenol hydroxylase-like FAD-dependent oxidoreductase
MKRVGAWDDEIRPRCEYMIRFVISGRNLSGGEVMAFDNKEFQNCFVGQAFVEDALRRRCDSLPNVLVDYQTELVDIDRCTQMLVGNMLFVMPLQIRQNSTIVTRKTGQTERRARVDLLFGCDGASSIVRQVCPYEHCV